MPVSYPVQWPSWWGVRAEAPYTDRPLVLTGARNGERYADQFGRPVWELTLTTVPVRGDDSYRAAAFIETLRSGMGTILLAAHPKRPLAYPGTGWAGINRHGGSAFNGTATVTAVSGNAVTITTLPSTYQVRAGDVISWPYGATRTLHRVVQDATASAGQVTVDVEPEVPPGVSYPQTVKLENADAVFRLAERARITIEPVTSPITMRFIQHLRL